MGAKSQFECLVVERQRRKFASQISSALPSSIVIIKESFHRCHAHSAKFFDGANLRPNKLRGVLLSLLYYLRICRLNTVLDFCAVEVVIGIHRSNVASAPGGFSVEAGGSVGAAKN